MTGDDDGDGLSTTFFEVEEIDGDDVCNTFDEVDDFDDDDLFYSDDELDEEFESIVQLQDKATPSKNTMSDRGRKPRPSFLLGVNHPLYSSHVAVIRMKMWTPMLAGTPPPKFPGNRPNHDESRIHIWNKEI